MKFSAMVRNGNYAVEIIDQTELMFRLMDRPSRAHDIADLMHGLTVRTNYSDYRRII